MTLVTIRHPIPKTIRRFATTIRYIQDKLKYRLQLDLVAIHLYRISQAI
jgi:hypothetical protein